MNPFPPPYGNMSYGSQGSQAAYGHNSNNNAAHASGSGSAQGQGQGQGQAQRQGQGQAQGRPPDYFINNSNAAEFSGQLPSFADTMDSSSHHQQQQQQQQQHQQQQQQQQQHHQQQPATPASGIGGLNFDILAWHPAYQSCQRYFLDHAQHEPATQAVCALINIRLPFQWHSAVNSSNPNSTGASNFNFNNYGRNTNSPIGRQQSNSSSWVSPVPYIRRLVVTGFDNPAILHGFFGDDYIKGVMPHVECERRNYLFAAKHGGWRSCKKQYDSGSGGGNGEDESLPFMKPMGKVEGEELDAADREWSKWLAFEDWMVGPRAVEEEDTRDENKHVPENSEPQTQTRGGADVDRIKVEGGAAMEDAGIRDNGLDEKRLNSGPVDAYGSR